MDCMRWTSVQIKVKECASNKMGIKIKRKTARLLQHACLKKLREARILIMGASRRVSSTFPVLCSCRVDVYFLITYP